MRIYNFVFHSKNLYIFFIIVSLANLFFSTVKVEAKAFDIEDIEISKDGIKCLITDIDYQGADIVLSLKLGNQEIFARLDSKKVDELDKEVFINWNEDNLHFFDFESGERIFENS